MNNSNFGYHFRNNVDNCNFKPMFDDIDEMSYIEKYSSLFDEAYKDFFCLDLLTQQIENDYNNDLMNIDENDPLADAKYHDIGQKRERKIDALKTCAARSK